MLTRYRMVPSRNKVSWRSQQKLSLDYFEHTEAGLPGSHSCSVILAMCHGFFGTASTCPDCINPRSKKSFFKEKLKDDAHIASVVERLSWLHLQILAWWMMRCGHLSQETK
ncbi:uncharacterized protein RHO17_014177 isoform 1-T1 [Thomomys bottae]